VWFESLLTTIEVLIDSFQPANVIVCVRNQMNVDKTIFAGVTGLQENNIATRIMFCFSIFSKLPVNSVKYSAVTETVLEPETAVFCQNCGEPKLQYFWSYVSGFNQGNFGQLIV